MESIHEFSIIEDNNNLFTQINILGKSISGILTIGEYQDGDALKCECMRLFFNGGEVLTLSAFDETFFASFSHAGDYDELKNDTTALFFSGIKGRKVVASTFCGKELTGSPLYLTIELDSGAIIEFSTSFSEDVLCVTIRSRG